MGKSNPIVPISEIQPGQKITSFYVIRKKEVRIKRDGTPYLALELGTDTGRMHSTLWKQVEIFNTSLKVGDVVKLRGSAIRYNDHIQLTIDRLRKADSADRIDVAWFLPKSDSEPEPLLQELRSSLESIQHPHLKSLAHAFLCDSELMGSFLKAPGGKLWHHAHVGGLVEHTYGVFTICSNTLQLYPALDRDLVLCAAFLHDIGKIREFSMDGFIDYSDEGRLIGHISIGARMVSEKMDAIPDFPDDLRQKLLHLILSHQGKLEHASPVVPQMPEAMLLYYADEMDSKINALLHVQERDREPGRRWSHYVPVLDRFIYLE